MVPEVKRERVERDGEREKKSKRQNWFIFFVSIFPSRGKKKQSNNPTSHCEYPTFFSRMASALAFIAALRASRPLASSPVRPTPPTAAEAGGGEAERTEAPTAAAPRRSEERAFLREVVVGAGAAAALEEVEEEEARTWKSL